MKKSNKVLTYLHKNITTIIIAIIFIMFVFLPIVTMFFTMSGKDISNVVHSPVFGKSIKNSLIAASLSTIISVVIAYFMALCVERMDIKCKSVFKIIFVLPMLIPSISNGMGILLLFGNNGLITNLFGLSSSIYGLPGIVLGSVLYSCPVAFLMISDIMKYEDALPYEAANVLGISKARQFKSITLPYLKKPLISTIFMVFSLVVTDYGVPLIVGGKFTTIPVILYSEVIGQLDFGKGVVYGCLLLVPAVLAFVIDVLNKDNASSAYTRKPFNQQKKLRFLIPAYIFCTLIAVITLLPIIEFCILSVATKYPINMKPTFDNVLKTFSMRADEYLMNSLLISFFVALVGVCISFFSAYLTARYKSKSSKFLHLSIIMSAAIPGLVLGLSYVMAFKGSFIYGTLAILIIVNIVHFISSPYLMIYNSLSKINGNIEGVGATLGLGRPRLIKDVFIPQCLDTIIEMFVYFFVNSMMTISAVSFLSTSINKPLSLLINRFEDRQIECAAVVSLIILIVNLTIKGLAFILRHIKFNINKKKKVA